MGWLEWKYEIEEANRAYFDRKEIDRETYEKRIKADICMIYRCGNEGAAQGYAKAHGYKLEDLLQDF